VYKRQGSTLTLGGSTTATANAGNHTILGGTLVVDQSSSTTPMLASTSQINLTGGGKFQLKGNTSSAFTLNVGNLPAGSNNVGGVNVFEVTTNGNATTLNFANSGTGFTTRPGTRGIYHFVATNGNLGDTSGARVTFTGSPFLGANGLLGQSSGGGTIGYAIVTDAGGTDFATWNATDGIVRATPTATVTDATGLAGLTATSRGQFNPAASTTITASGAVTSGSLRITPAGAGSTLAMGANNLATNALMIDGGNDFAITGTGTLGGTGTRYIYVNDPNVTLSTSIVIANGTNPTTIAGPGFVDLTGTGSQNTLTTTNRLIFGGGVVRANNTQLNFSNTSTASILSFTDGVLEIKNGSNGAGASADFTRALGAAGGNVTWGAGTTTSERGGGGFSAFGSAASVNIGGSATPGPLQWGQTDFIADGFALKFGSTKSNAVLNWLNPLQLDNGAGYQAREINVTAGVGGDKTVMQGVISGAANADLIKTGTGTLELTANNTYSGSTTIAGGTLIVNGTHTGGGAYTVAPGGTLGGVGTINANVYVGGTLAAGNSIGTLTVDGNVVFNSISSFNVEINSTALTSDLLAVTGASGVLNLGGATLNLVDLAPLAITTGTINIASYVSRLGTFSGLNDGDIISLAGNQWSISYGTGTNSFVSLQAIPEPTALLMVGMAVAGFGVRRRRRS
jgi:autotransporter-associated beta strand protein